MKVNLSLEEKERIEKIFLEEMESLRREESNLVREFAIELEDNIFLDYTSDDFSLDKNIKLFLQELSETEKKLYDKQGEYDQGSVFQTLSRLRILKEQAKTILAKTQHNLRGL